ncbi:MAG: hypothetical protein AAF982_01365 [Pseudomonadota bacterium]
MSDTDSFIEEVKEEVRRDRLFGLMRRYGWIAVLLIALLVGGASWNEISKAKFRNQAQAFGDALLAATEAEDPGAAFSGIEAEDAQAVLARLLAAQFADGETMTLLQALAEVEDIAPIYRDLAALKLVIAEGTSTRAEDRLARLDALAVPGGAFRVLALEQRALILAEQGDRDGAVEILQSLRLDRDASADLRWRASQLIVALQGEMDPA